MAARSALKASPFKEPDAGKKSQRFLPTWRSTGNSPTLKLRKELLQRAGVHDFAKQDRFSLALESGAKMRNLDLLRFEIRVSSGRSWSGIGADLRPKARRENERTFGS